MLAAVVLVLAALVTSSSQSAVTVSVFYESLCSDSVNFLVEQLYPTSLSLDSRLLNIDFVPYGKASHAVKRDSIDISCHFGAMGCRANTIQSCGLALLSGKPKKQVEFVVCVMNNTRPQAAERECAAQVDLTLNSLAACINGTNGKVLLASHGFRTHALMPNIDFVPSIMYNGEFSQEDQDESLKDFRSVVCSHMSDEDQESCSNANLGRTKSSAAILLVAVVAFTSLATSR